MDTPVTAKCKHTDQPLSYMKWHCWAEKKQKTHRQRKCPHCGLWALWVPKPVKPAEKGGGEENESLRCHTCKDDANKYPDGECQHGFIW